ncbi:uncharacterized protein LOC134495752 [Candoia aspera]|uniref:uncharacterized protein LOC134495752 n=1 Tax=Candoia aspera TaxID=51853 RepID=UPI002FD84322
MNMEPEEGHKEDQSGSAGNEGTNPERKVEKTNSEVSKGAAKSLPETAEELEGQDQRETGLFVSPAAREAEKKTPDGIDQWEIKEREEEGIVGEGGIFLEMYGKKVVSTGQDQREKEVHPDTEEKNDYQHNLDEKKIKETTDREGMALEKVEVLALDRNYSEGRTGEEVVETAENQIEDNQLSRLGQGGSLEMTEEGKNVAVVVGQGKAEEMLSTGDTENMALGGDATSVVYQRETEESVGLGVEQNKLFTKAGDSALDEAETRVLVVPNEEESGEIIKGEMLTFGEYQDKKIAEVDQRETDSLTAGGAEVPVESQGKPEEVLENLREDGEITAERDATMVEEEARLLEANQMQVEETGKEEVPSARSQGKAGKAPGPEVDQVEAEMGIEEKDAMSTPHQTKAEELVEGSQGESVKYVEPVEEQKLTAEGDVTLTVVESKAKYLQETSEVVMGGEDITLVVETEEEKVGEGTAEEDVTETIEDKTEDLVETSEGITGKEDVVAAVEAERETVAKVTAEDDVSLPVVEVKVESLVGINEILMGEEDMALNVEAKGETVEQLITEKDVALTLDHGGEVTEAPESISRIQEEIPQIVVEEIPVQSQEKTSKEKMESEVVEEKVGDLTEPEQRPAEQVGLYQRESKELASAGMIDKMETGELEVALAINQNEVMEGLRPFQEKAEIAVIGDENLTLRQQDAVGEKLPSQEKILVWSPELEGPTQKIVGVGSGEGISRSDKKEVKQSQEHVAELGLDQVQLLETSMRITEELGKLGFSVAPSPLSQHTAMGSEEHSRKRKGKIILGLAGLRQGPIPVTRRGPTRSAGGYNGVLAHIAPGLIVTGLTKAEQKRPIKQGHKQLKTEQRETRSAEQGRFGVRRKSSEAVVLMGYRIGREGMSCSSEAEKRMVKVQQVPELEEIEKKPAVEQAEVSRQEQEGRKEEAEESNANKVARHHLEELSRAWLGRPWTQDYTAAQGSSGSTAGIGPGHGRTSGSLQAKIKERINMMVMGEGTKKSAAQSPELLHFGMRRRVFGLTSKSTDVHWLNEVLRPRPAYSKLGVTGHKAHDKEGSPELMTERQSPGLLTRKKELKDWRDGVMGIAIKRYNAMRLAMWGEGPVGLHIRGMKLAEDSCAFPSSTSKMSSILGHVERRMFKMAQHVASETITGLEVDGQRLTEELARSKKGER